MSYQVETVTPAIGGTPRHGKQNTLTRLLVRVVSKARYDLKDKSLLTIVWTPGFIALSHMRSCSIHLTS